MLVLCAACRRHVRAHEEVCPFCRAAREPSHAPERSFVVTTRAAFLAGGIALASAAAGCNTGAGPGSSGTSGTSGIAQPYGAPPNPQPLDAGKPTPPPSTTITAAAPAYGAPPPQTK
ncbi:MAG: hypothetical protein JNL38_03175 [Myxococcales bacterium]|jgi:hypothetical protein|nr:hypothetical protein [Myxococcales bacterium]